MASRNSQPRSTLSELSDEALLNRLKLLVRASNRQLAELLEHLAEVDERKLHRGQACSSMFTYCTERLHLSEGAAYKRISAARVIRRFPVLLERLATGELHLSAIILLAPVLTDDNIQQLVGEAVHKSKRQVEELVARHAPRTVVRPHLRRLPKKPTPRATSDESEAQASLGDVAAETEIQQPTDARPPSGSTTPPRSNSQTNRILSPLDGERYRLQLTATRQLRDKLLTAQQLSRPGRTLPDVIERGLDELIAKLKKQRFADVARPRTTSKPAGATGPRRSRRIPAAVRRKVVERDGLQCSFVSTDGHRCTERSGLELHHHQPFACGGDHTVDNISLLCRTHNRYCAEQDFGIAHMQRCAGQVTRDDKLSSCVPEGRSMAPGPRKVLTRRSTRACLPSDDLDGRKATRDPPSGERLEAPRTSGNRSRALAEG